MTLVLDHRKAGGRHKSRLQQRFEKLRDRLERERRLNARFRQVLDELIEIYQRRSFENDKRLLDELLALSEKLIGFAGRKTLSDRHRRQLDEWLRELIEERIFAVDREVAERLRLEYREALARAHGISVEELFDRLEADCDDADVRFGEGGNEQHAERRHEAPPQEDLFGFDDFDLGGEESSFDAGFDPKWAGGMDDTDTADFTRTVMDGSWAKDLFRRATQALHPDREPDPERRQVKQERLRDLLRARKQNDVMAVLTIYSETVSDADIVVADETMTEICNALQDQLYDIESEKQQYIYSHPVRQLVFDVFYHSTKKGRSRRIRQWESGLREEGRELRDLITVLRNLPSLKRVLDCRRNEHADMLAEVLFGDFRF